MAQIMEQRRTKRFRIKLPVEITQLSGKRVSRPGHTFDISSGGVCFSSNRDFEVGGRIEYLVTLSQAPNTKVQIKCLGRVLRIVRLTDQTEYTCQVVASLDRYSFTRLVNPTAN
ncbi:MAG TPA: PilZ domain-containing protein [Bryobacteraceae bacterium]